MDDLHHRVLELKACPEGNVSDDTRSHVKNNACTSETGPVQINIHNVVNGRHTKKTDMTSVLQSYLKIIFFGHRAKRVFLCMYMCVHVSVFV